MFTTRNMYIASSNKCLTSSNKKLQNPSLLLLELNGCLKDPVRQS